MRRALLLLCELCAVASMVRKSDFLHPLQTEDHPSSSVGGLYLSNIFTFVQGEIVHHELTEEVMEDRRRRKLVEYNMTDGCCGLSTERDVS
jgi:hypothetical protein